MCFTYVLRRCNIYFFAVIVSIISSFLLKFNTGLPQILTTLGSGYTAVFSIVGKYSIDGKYLSLPTKNI